MVNVQLPSNSSSKDNLKKAFTYKDGSYKYSYTNTELDLLLKLYEKYDENKGVLVETDVDLVSVQSDLKSATKEAYKEVQKYNRLSDFRTELLSLSKKCPICRFNKSDTLDHQLPKNKFEVYSIYSRNLAPMCGICNNLKRTCEVGSEEESFYHIYYEKLPLEHFLKASFTIEEKYFFNFTFFIEKIDGMSDILFGKLNFIFNRLNLDERFNEEISEYLSDLKVSFKQQSDFTIIKFLDESICEQMSRFGFNHWKTAILISLRESKVFCTTLYNKYNPDVII